MHLPGSRKSLILVTALYSLHTYRIVVITVPLCAIGRGIMSVVGWSLVVTKANWPIVTIEH